MNIWLERFALAVLAAFAVATILYNPWQLDRFQRATLIVALIALSLFAARTIERSRFATPDLVIEFDEATDLWRPNGNRQIRGHVRIRNSNATKSLLDVALRVEGIEILRHPEGEADSDQQRTVVRALVGVPLMKREQPWSMTSPPTESWLLNGGETISFEVFNVERAGGLSIVQARSNTVSNRQGVFHVAAYNSLPPGQYKITLNPDNS